MTLQLAKGHCRDASGSHIVYFWPVPILSRCSTEVVVFQLERKGLGVAGRTVVETELSIGASHLRSFLKVSFFLTSEPNTKILIFRTVVIIPRNMTVQPLTRMTRDITASLADSPSDLLPFLPLSLMLSMLSPFLPFCPFSSHLFKGEYLRTRFFFKLVNLLGYLLP